MLARINGFSPSGVLGYFYGKNALVSVAVTATGEINVKDTGAVASYAELTRFLNTTDETQVAAYLNDKNIVTIAGEQFTATDTLEADYTAAYAAQTNLKRIIDVVQQRAVILSTSEIATSVSVAGFTDLLATGSVAVADASVITFLIERGNVFDKDTTSFQGVPTGVIQVGRSLVEDLTGVPMLDTSANVINLASGSSTGGFGVKIYKTIPALSL